MSAYTHSYMTRYIYVYVLYSRRLSYIFRIKKICCYKPTVDKDKKMHTEMEMNMPALCCRHIYIHVNSSAYSRFSRQRSRGNTLLVRRTRSYERPNLPLECSLAKRLILYMDRHKPLKANRQPRDQATYSDTSQYCWIYKDTVCYRWTFKPATNASLYRVLGLYQLQSNSVITPWKGLNILCRYKRVLL
jgi:hypothetical protein